MVKTLKDFPLRIDQMEELGLKPIEYALAMADALAFMLFVLNTDAGGVEFVLASPRVPPATDADSSLERDPHIGTRIFSNGVLALHTMWVLDFDSCRPITLDSSGVERAADCFVENDPFYPRPTVSGWSMVGSHIFSVYLLSKR
jgi:hypothetical protein